MKILSKSSSIVGVAMELPFPGGQTPTPIERENQVIFLQNHSPPQTCTKWPELASLNYSTKKGMALLFAQEAMSPLG